MHQFSIFRFVDVQNGFVVSPCFYLLFRGPICKECFARKVGCFVFVLFCLRLTWRQFEGAVSNGNSGVVHVTFIRATKLMCPGKALGENQTQGGRKKK
jgi:hypothetical protein